MSINGEKSADQESFEARLSEHLALFAARGCLTGEDEADVRPEKKSHRIVSHSLVNRVPFHVNLPR